MLLYRCGSRGFESLRDLWRFSEAKSRSSVVEYRRVGEVRGSNPFGENIVAQW